MLRKPALEYYERKHFPLPHSETVPGVFGFRARVDRESSGNPAGTSFLIRLLDLPVVRSDRLSPSIDDQCSDSDDRKTDVPLQGLFVQYHAAAIVAVQFGVVAS